MNLPNQFCNHSWQQVGSPYCVTTSNNTTSTSAPGSSNWICEYRCLICGGRAHLPYANTPTANVYVKTP